MGNSASKAPAQDAALFDAHSLSKLQELLTSGRVVSIDVRDGHGATRLFYAESVAVAELLLKHGADVNARNRNDETPLLVNVEENDLRLTKLLLERGADVNAVTAYECAALHLAQNVDMVRLLVEHGANVNATDREGKNPLFEAVRLGSAQTVQVLLDAGADVTLRDKYGETAMFLISEHTSVSILEMLIKHGASADIY